MGFQYLLVLALEKRYAAAILLGGGYDPRHGQLAG